MEIAHTSDSPAYMLWTRHAHRVYSDGMAKKNLHILMEEPLAAAIQRYATGHGVSFTAALSMLAARGLRDEGIIPAQGENQS